MTKRKQNSSYEAIADRKDKAAAFMRRVGKRSAANAIDHETVEHYALRKGILLENPRRRARKSKKNGLGLGQVIKRTAKVAVKAAILKKVGVLNPKMPAKDYIHTQLTGEHRRKKGTYCEMCGRERGLKPGLDPSGKRRTLCALCRRGSAQLLKDRKNPKRRNGKLLHFPASSGSKARAAKTEIREIDRKIDAIIREVKRLRGRKLDRMSAASWQEAWDLYPEKKRRIDDLYRRRGEQQQLRDANPKRKKNSLLGRLFKRAAHKAKKSVKRSAGMAARAALIGAGHALISRGKRGPEHRLARMRSRSAGSSSNAVSKKKSGWDALSQAGRADVARRAGYGGKSAEVLASSSWKDLPQGWTGRIAAALKNPKKSVRRISAAKSAATAAARTRGTRRQQLRRRRNGAADDAAGMYKTFTGKDPDKIVDIQEAEIRRDNYAKLGDLVSVRYRNHSGAGEISFKDDGNNPVMLCCDAKGKQLYIIGGDQDLTPSLRQLGVDGSKDFVDIGECTRCDYLARKKFDDFDPTVYYHKLGEESGVPPRLMFDKLNRRLYFVGGEYTIEDRGIVN